MLSVPVNKNIEEIKDDFFMGFSFRETIHLVASFISILGTIALCTFIAGINIAIATWIGMPIAFAICANGFVSINKMTAMEITKKKITIMFTKPLDYVSEEANFGEFIEVKSNNSKKKIREEKKIG